MRNNNVGLLLEANMFDWNLDFYDGAFYKLKLIVHINWIIQISLINWIQELLIWS